MLKLIPHIEEAYQTRKIRLKVRRGSVVSAIAGPSPFAETVLFLFLFLIFYFCFKVVFVPGTLKNKTTFKLQ